jgi:hypothetical protein
MKRSKMLLPALALGCLICAPGLAKAQGTIDQSAAGAMNGESGGGINGQTDPTLFGDPQWHRKPQIHITYISLPGTGGVLTRPPLMRPESKQVRAVRRHRARVSA